MTTKTHRLRHEVLNCGGMLVCTLICVTTISLAGCSRQRPGEKDRQETDLTEPQREQAVSDETQHHIDRGRFLLHCFEHELARFEFLQALEVDPEAAVAHCGIALSYDHPLTLARDTNALHMAIAAMQRAKSAKHATAVDRSLIEAYAPFYEMVGVSNHQVRIRNTLAGLTASNEQYPDDIEIATALALLHLAARPMPLNNDFSHERMVAKVLWPLRQQHLDHVGLLHYLILAHDGKAEDARMGLPAATLISHLTDAVPLTRRAPAHLFFRLGMWPDAVHATRAANDSAKSLLATMAWPAEKRDFESAVFHMHALVNAGRPAEAKKLLDELRIIAFETKHPIARAAARRARHIYLLEGRLWTQAIEAKLDIGDDAEKDMLAHAASVAGGFHRAPFVTGNGLEYFRKRLELVDPVRILEVDACLAMINDNVARVHEQMQKAVQFEATRGTRTIVPSPPIPARELYGEMLLAMHLPEAAAEQFELCLKDRVNRPMSLFGLAKARMEIGQREEAILPLLNLMGAWSVAETNFAPLAHAKELLGQANASVEEAPAPSAD